MREFRCQHCNSLILRETKRMSFGDVIEQHTEALQGHTFGDPANCKNCGLHFKYDMCKAELWTEIPGWGTPLYKAINE